MTEATRVLGDRYRLGPSLGFGGMADVFRGFDTRLGRDVAIKLLRQDLARDPAFRARFRREAQAAASLSHPWIVSVFDTGEDDTGDGPAMPFIVMELVEGQTLREVLADAGQLPPVAALDICADVCAALHYSHERGLVHRDVKPGNIMITQGVEGETVVKVMDFGIARAATSTQTVTQTAAVLGTAQYLSPEQARGQAVDPRSDVYSTGCVLFELLTGGPPFTGDSPVAVAYQQVREDPPLPSSLVPGLSPDIDAVVFTAMAKNPDNRYQTAEEMRDDLARAADGQPVHAAPALAVVGAEEETGLFGRSDVLPQDGSSGRRLGLLLGLLLLLLVLLAGGAVLVGRALGGAEQVAVPSVLGLTRADAQERLQTGQLMLGPVTEEFGPQPLGTVISQDPGPGSRADIRSPVSLVVSRGLEQVAVPRLVGLQQAAAEESLRTQGLVVGEVTTSDVAAQAGEVISSDPQQDTPLPPGSAVSLVVASGERSVPSVVGDDVAAAAAQLGRAGFRVAQETVVDGSATPGTVLSQDPSGGSSASAGSTVSLTVAAAPTVAPAPTATRTSASPEPSPRSSSSPRPEPTSEPTAEPTATSTPSP